MTIPNTVGALEVLREFRDHLLHNNAIHERHKYATFPGESNPSYDDASYRELQRLAPLVEEIASAVESDPTRHRPPSVVVAFSGMWSWSTYPRWVERLIGILENRARRNEIFNPAGPSLSAPQLHSWVWNAATDLWGDGHYREAVQAAATAVERQTKLKIDRGDLSGAKLYAEAFGLQTKPGTRRLRFPHLEAETSDGQTTQDWNSAHDGAASFGRGCSLGIRNVVSHNIEALTEQVALEHLAALSVLARWVDTTEVQVD